MRHAMHDPVSHRLDRRKHLLRFEPIQQKGHRPRVIGFVDALTTLRLSSRVVNPHIRAAQTDAIHLPIQATSQRFIHLIQQI